MKKLRIAVITTEFVTEQYFFGGIANHWYRLFKTISSWGHEVHIITLSYNNNDSFNYDGLQIHRIKVGSNSSRFQRGINRLSNKRFAQTVCRLNFSWEAYRKINQLHQKQPFDVIHMTNYLASGLVTSLLMRIPYLVLIASYAPVWNELAGIERNLDEKATEWLEWLHYRISPHVYAPSNVMKRMVEQKVKLFKVRVIKTPIFLETHKWDFSSYDKYLKDKKYLLFFGRYQLHKGFHILAQALPKAMKVHSDLHAVFVGCDLPSPLASSMKEYALSINREYSERLVFINQLPHSQLYPIITGALLVVLPSLLDNLPNTLMESMALGKPVIGTLGASFDELITDGENGFLVPIGDVEALAEKIIDAWTHPNLDAIAQAAKHKAQELSPERTVREILDYYEEIIDEKQYKSKKHE
jgi:glycosyltransferase involved in cell wall biosynthesis